MASCLFLVKSGYGSLEQVEAMDTKTFLDCLENEEIRNAIEKHVIDEANK